MANPVHTFKRKLTNLSSANPYLFLRRLKADVFLDLPEIEKTTLQPAWEIINAIFQDKKSIPICPIVNPGDGEETRLSLKINSLLKRQKLTIQERGSNELQLAFPFVLGLWPDGSWVKTPLLLLPISISKDSKNWYLKADKEEIMVHPAFLLAYSFHFQQPLEETLFEKPLNLDPEDGIGFLTQLYQILKESRLDVHFNQELFGSRISSFTEVSKSDPPMGFQPGMLKLQPEAVLGLFPQSDSILIPDFQYLEDNKVDLETIFLKNIQASTTTPREKEILPVLPMDGSQEACLKEIKKGKSILVKGPPGTGKSQLIANLMADAIGEGKTVLLVCQKRVALEVVQRRLAECGLGDFVGLWADYRNDKSQLFQQLAHQIEWIDQRKLEDSNLKTVVLERRFAQICQQLDQIVEKLEKWKSGLYNQLPVGISLLELYKKESEKFDFNSKIPDLTQWNQQDWLEWKEWLRKYWDSLVLIYGEKSPLRQKGLWNHLSINELVNHCIEIKNDLTTLIKNGKEFGFENLSHQAIEFQDLVVNYQKFKNEIEYIQSSPLSWILHFSPNQWLNEGFLEKRLINIGIIKEELDQIIDWPTNWTPSLNDLEKDWQLFSSLKYIHINRSFIKVLSLFDSHYRRFLTISSHFSKGKTSGKEILNTLNRTKIIGAHFKEIHPDSDHRFSQNWFNQLRNEVETALNEEKRLEEFLNLIHQLDEKRSSINSWQACLKKAESIIQLEENLRIQEKKWRFLFPESAGMLSDFPQMETIISFLAQHSAEINQLDHSIAKLDEKGIQLALALAREATFKGKPKAEILTILEQAWTQDWINKLETEYPVFTQVGTEIWEEDLSILRQNIGEKQETAREILSLKVREKTYKNLEFNRLGNRVSYRELYHQATKKRQRLSLRQMWERYGTEIKSLIPAWLGTPESVSATWPMAEIFDLVIFDEASQCFAERSLPAAYRGKQLVIVGDDQQLPPHHLFSARWEEDGEDDLYSGQDSLLDLGRQFLPMLLLKQHYRSHFPELIAFSNQHFYQGFLQSIPEKNSFFRKKGAIKYQKVEGSWQNQRNEAEALWIAENLLKNLKQTSGESYGVITFNASQQDLVERTIEKYFGKNECLVPDNLFVKNIENVQGDERDHILFSIAYGPGENGKINAQFGSLAISGGENRLNVAITRAKKSMTIVASIMPDELPVSEQSPKGPRLLKAFLKFAFELSKSGDSETFTPSAYQQSLSDDFKIEPAQDIVLEFHDDSHRMETDSMKNYFGYNFMNLSAKGYSVRYIFQRNIWKKARF